MNEASDFGQALDITAAYVKKRNAKWWLDLERPCVYCNTRGLGVTGIKDCPKCKGDAYERKDRNVGELLMLVTSKLSEALEGHRTNSMDDHLPQFDMFTVELADAVIRILDIAGNLCPQFGKAFDAKMEYNKTRKDHTIEERLKENGKKI